MLKYTLNKFLIIIFFLFFNINFTIKELQAQNRKDTILSIVNNSSHELFFIILKDSIVSPITLDMTTTPSMRIDFCGLTNNNCFSLANSYRKDNTYEGRRKTLLYEFFAFSSSTDKSWAMVWSNEEKDAIDRSIAVCQQKTKSECTLKLVYSSSRRSFRNDFIKSIKLIENRNYLGFHQIVFYLIQ